MSEEDKVFSSRSNNVQQDEQTDIEDTESYEKELERNINQPFSSPDEAAVIIGNIMARAFILATKRWVRISANMKHRPASHDFWNAYRDLVEGGSKTVAALKIAYSWEEALRQLKGARILLKQMLADKKITPEQYKQAEEQMVVLEEKMRDANRAS